MHCNKRILAICGSTRAGSFNRKLLSEAVEALSRLGATVTVANLAELAMPFYDGDVEEKHGMPAGAKRLRALLRESDGVVMASPEHNGAVTAILKNALDWTSRNEAGQPSNDAFKGKPCALMSASPGPAGGARSLANLRTILNNVSARILERQVTVGSCFKSFDADGRLAVPSVKNDVEALMRELVTVG